MGAVTETADSDCRPWSYAGLVWLVEQRFRAANDYLHGINVWSHSGRGRLGAGDPPAAP